MTNVTAIRKEPTAHEQAHRLRGTIARLNGEIADAERTIMNAEGRANDLALQVLLGKATQADQEQHRREVAKAREAQEDRRAVRDAAKAELARLEAAENAEKNAAAAAEARKLVAQRIDAARKFDEAAKMMQAAYSEFAELGHAIPSTGVHLKMSPGDMARWEAIRGDHRVDGALPDLFAQLHRNIIRAGKIPSLEASEAALWRALLPE